MTCVTCGAQLAPTDATCPTCGEVAGGEQPTGGPAIGTVAAATGRGSADADTGGADAPPPPPSDGGAGQRPGPGTGSGTGSGGAAGSPPPSGGAAGGAYGPPPGGVAGQPGTPAPHPSGLSSELRGWAIGAHLGGLVLGVLTAAILGFLAPMLVWLLKRDEHPYLDHHAKEALNFQLTVIVAVVVGALLMIPAVIFGVLTLGIGFVVLGVVLLAAVIVWFAFPIMGAVKASNGEGFRYPLSIRFIA